MYSCRQFNCAFCVALLFWQSRKRGELIASLKKYLKANHDRRIRIKCNIGKKNLFLD